MGLVEIGMGHGEVVHGGDGGGFRWVLLWISNGVKISGDSTPLTQKERCPKKHSKNLSFLRGNFLVSHKNTI